jgi:SAM-dependent methyltransferase
LGFSADWLALREPADHFARDAALLRRAVSAAGPNPVILDLGCGTGSTVRALAPLLPKNTQWRLVDNDPELLRLAGLTAGDSATLHQLDLGDIDSLPLGDVTLVTGSALIDLVSKQWLEQLALGLSIPVYLALSYDGEMSWQPENDLDATVSAAFNSHQRTDKGFGPALGPDSVTVASEVFRARGFEVVTARSPWQLGPEQAQLQRELVAGISQAARDFGLQGAELWETQRIAAADQTLCQIGHADLLAIPRPVSEQG